MHFILYFCWIYFYPLLSPCPFCTRVLSLLEGCLGTYSFVCLVEENKLVLSPGVGDTMWQGRQPLSRQSSPFRLSLPRCSQGGSCSAWSQDARCQHFDDQKVKTSWMTPSTRIHGILLVPPQTCMLVTIVSKRLFCIPTLWSETIQTVSIDHLAVSLTFFL